MKGVSFILWTVVIVLCGLRACSLTVNYVHVGCFKDTRNRTMPKLLGNWRTDSNEAIKKCAWAAKNAGYLAFGVQFAGECWSGLQAHMTFSIHGTSSKCVNGLGGAWAQDVYWYISASQIANYEMLRCYEVDVLVHYNIPGGLTLSIDDIKNSFSSLLHLVSSFPPLFPECSGITVTLGQLSTSPPGQSSAFVKQTVIFTASTNLPDNNVPTKLKACIDFASNAGKTMLDSNLPKLSQNGQTYSAFNKSTISNKRSCCGGDIPPPCCAVGSEKVSSNQCGCLPGYHFVPGSLCDRCPNDTYQNKHGQTSCKKCPGKKKTFGKTGAFTVSNCTVENPLQILNLPTTYLPKDISPFTSVLNVTVTGNLAILVKPFLYYIDSVTQQPQSRQSKKRKKREVGDVCETAGTVAPQSYFCIHRRSGKIAVTDEFQFNDGDVFELTILVTDTDRWGVTKNTAKVTLVSRDRCRNVSKFYDDAANFCPVDDTPLPFLCPGVNCLQPLYSWQEALANATLSLTVDCSSDPRNLKRLIQQYSECIGPPNVTVHPESMEVDLDKPALLTCNATSPLTIEIAWFKDGKPMERFGAQLTIPNMDYKDQGIYNCKFTTAVTSSFSRPALLALKGFLTSIVSFKILNEKYETDLSVTSSSRYSDLQVRIERPVQNFLDSGNFPWNFTVKLSGFRDLCGKVGVDLAIYSKANMEDIVKYYETLESSLGDDNVNQIFTSLKVSRKTVTIRSSTHCLPEKTGKESVMGVFQWNLTIIGLNSSLVQCFYGPADARASRFCGGNFSFGGVWSEPNVANCKYKLERTNKLNDLKKTSIDKQNVVQVTKEVKSLTSSPDEMNEADAILIADVIENIISLEGSLNETSQDVLDVIDNVMQMKTEDLQESQRSTKASNKFVQALVKISTDIPLSDQQSSRRLVSSSVAIQANRVDSAKFSGMSLVVKARSDDPDKLTPDSMVSDELPAEEVQTSITLPSVMFDNKSPVSPRDQIGFVIYQNNKLFQPVVAVDDEVNNASSAAMMSRVISCTVKNHKFEKLQQPVELVFKPKKNIDESSGDFHCVFWDFEASDGLGDWSDRGCEKVGMDSGRVKCQCDHMTNFAVLFSAGGPKKHDEEHAKALSIITYVGCALSLIGLTITLLTYALFRNLRKTNQQPILMNLCASLMFLLIFFVAGAEQTENLIGCRIVAVLLHYFALSSVMWMGVEGYNMYMSFVKVMATYQSKFILKASTVAWGLPAVVVVITVSAATSYYGNEYFCVLHGIPFQAAMFAPVLVIILVNFVIFTLAIRSLSRTGALVSAEKKATSYKRARTSVAILILLGLTWVFGALAVSRAQLAFDYLFCIFNSLQGFFIFYFHCLRHAEVRNQWKWFLRGKGTRYHPSSSDSRTGYPKTYSKAHNNELSIKTPTRKSMGRKQTFSTNDGDATPTMPRPDVIPAEV